MGITIISVTGNRLITRMIYEAKSKEKPNVWKRKLYWLRYGKRKRRAHRSKAGS